VEQGLRLPTRYSSRESSRGWAARSYRAVQDRRTGPPCEPSLPNGTRPAKQDQRLLFVGDGLRLIGRSWGVRPTADLVQEVS
jgi:hypothetical protein